MRRSYVKKTKIYIKKKTNTNIFLSVVWDVLKYPCVISLQAGKVCGGVGLSFSHSGLLQLAHNTSC